MLDLLKILGEDIYHHDERFYELIHGNSVNGYDGHDEHLFRMCFRI
jgi:hypothetical protein